MTFILFYNFKFLYVQFYFFGFYSRHKNSLFKSQHDGQGLAVDGCQLQAMGDGIIHQPDAPENIQHQQKLMFCFFHHEAGGF